MTNARSQYRLWSVLLLASALVPVQAVGQAQTGLVWENATELSFVSTGGNASSSTLGLKSSLVGTSGPNSFKIELGGIRGETNVTTRVANGSAGSFTVTETSTSQLTAESYFARTRFDRTVSGAFVFAGAGWDRNTFAGIQNRYAGVAGVGRTWVDGETGRLKTDLGLTYTIQKDVAPAAGADNDFAGLRMSVDARRRVSSDVEYATVLLVDENLEETEDFRADWTHSLSVALSQALAFKTSVQLLFDNQPALIAVPLSTGGVPTGTNVLAPGDELDTVLTVALVIKL